MPPLKITTPSAGGVSLLSWLDLPSNVQPVENLADVIVPVMEQRAFQEKWFYLTNEANLTIGQFVVFEYHVPENESWRLDYLGILQDDTGSLDFRVRIVTTPGIDASQDIIQKEIESGFSTLLYPARNLQNNITTSIGQEFNGEELILLPGETLLISSSATAGAATQVNLRARYELRPLPIQGPELSPVIVDLTIT